MCYISTTIAGGGQRDILRFSSNIHGNLARYCTAAMHQVTARRAINMINIVVLTVCVCVFCFFPFILDIKGRTSRGHTGGRSHRISHPPSFCCACLNFSREKDSAIPFHRRP